MESSSIESMFGIIKTKKVLTEKQMEKIIVESVVEKFRKKRRKLASFDKDLFKIKGIQSFWK